MELGRVVDGKALADGVLQGIRRKMEGFSDKPCLAVVCVGSRKESDSFVRSKIREAQVCGVEVIVKRFDGAIGEQVRRFWLGPREPQRRGTLSLLLCAVFVLFSCPLVLS
jgi:hypothetical protein